MQDALGFIPPVGDAYKQLWQAFLERRYETIAALNRAYQNNFSAFDGIPQFDTLPLDGPALHDWYQFQSVVLAMHNAAHRFTVLLPAPSTGGAEDY